MSAAVKHKVFRYSEPKGIRLAKLVYERCKKNVDKYNASGKGRARVTELMKSHTDDGYRYFHITGRTPAQENAWKAAWTKYYGEPEALRQLERSRNNTNLMMHGKSYGWNAAVHLTIEGPFDISVDDADNVPSEIMKCLVATYNELVEDRES